ncbi:MAG: hypothetical protein DME46_00660 [Verrucomicrobia bacterium]|nr:MAG: hypothetical protein DME46_00660 [Verrucomicrobiota bacterium]
MIRRGNKGEAGSGDKGETKVAGRATLPVLRFHRLAAATMAALPRHVCAAAHPMLWWLRHFTADRQAHGEDRRSNDQDKAAR